MFNILSSKKKCIDCGEWKQKNDFRKNKQTKDGLRPYCKTCESVREKERYAADPDRFKGRVKAWRRNNPEKTSEMDRKKQQRWAVLYPDKERNRKKKWRLANLELARELARNWVRNNLGKSNTNTRNRRAKIKGVGGTITLQEWEELKAFYNYTCLCCGRREPEIKLTLDHVVPIDSGGPNLISNAQPLCGSCNSSKSTKTIDYRR